MISISKIRPGYIYIESKYSYPPSKEELKIALQEFAEIGFRYIELEGVGEKHLQEMMEQKKYWKGFCEKLNLYISNFIIILPEIASLGSTQREHARKIFEKAVSLAKYFGCETIDLDSFTPEGVEFLQGKPYLEIEPSMIPPEVRIGKGFNWEVQWNSFVETLKICNRIAKEAGIKLVIHPRAYEIISNTDDFLKLSKEINDENLGFILDTAHLFAQKEILPLSIEKTGNRIFHVHISDSDGKSLRHLPIGEGIIDWMEVFKILKKHNFSGQFVIDISDSNVKESFKKAKNFLEQSF